MHEEMKRKHTHRERERETERERDRERDRDRETERQRDRERERERERLIRHGSSSFTWRSRFLEARDQESLSFVSYVSKRKRRRGSEEEEVSFKKKKMTLEQAFPQTAEEPGEGEWTSCQLLLTRLEREVLGTEHSSLTTLNALKSNIYSGLCFVKHLKCEQAARRRQTLFI